MNTLRRRVAALERECARLRAPAHDATLDPAEPGPRASERRFRDFAEASSDWFWEMGPDLRFSWFSDEVLKGTGIRTRDLIGRSGDETGRLAGPTSQWHQHVARLRARQPFKDVRYLAHDVDGKEVYASISGVPVFAEDGAFLGYRGSATNITAQVRAEQAAARAHAMFADAIESVSEGFAMFDQDDRLVLRNDGFRRHLEPIADRLDPHFHWGDMLRSMVDHGLLEAPAEPLDGWIEEQLRAHHTVGSVRQVEIGAGRWVQIRQYPTRDGGFATVMADITALKRAEEALKASERRFRDFAEASSDWFWEMGPDLRFSWFSRDCLEGGIRTTPLIGRTRRLAGKSDPDSRKWRAHLADLHARRAFRDFRYRIDNDAREAVYVSISGVPVYDDDGAFLGYRGIGKDITCEVVAERRAAEAQTCLAEALESISEGFALFDRDDRLVVLNEHCRRSLAGIADLLEPGVSWEATFRAMVDRGLVVVPDEDREAWTEQQISRHRSRQCVRHLEMGDGRWVEVREYPTRDGGLALVRADITELKQAEEAQRRAHDELEIRVEKRTAALRATNRALKREIGEHERTEAALRESRGLLEAIVEAAAMGINVKDPGLRYVFMNAYQAGIYGVAPESAVGKTPGELINPQYGEYIRTYDLRVLEHGEPLPYFEEEIPDKDGLLRTWLTTKVPVKDERGVLHYIVSSSLDITELKARERELKQAQKMDAVGKLTGGIAHDFNNLLFVIRGNLALLQDEVGESGAAREYLSAIQDAAKLGADLTRSLLAFSRQQRLRPALVDLQEIVAHAAAGLLRPLEPNVAIETSYPDDAWPVMVDRNQMENALLNLALNARDAMPGGGRLAIAVENRRLRSGQIRRKYRLPPGDYVSIAITDTGAGMPSDVIEHAFDPFFTTKPAGSGTGLGLSMVYGFIKQSGGFIEIESTVDEGTTITMDLPRAEGVPARRRGAPAARRWIAKGSETILITEDDAAVRRVAVRILSKLGYRTREACTGSEALEILEREPRVDLLFADVVLSGGLNGAQLAREAQTRKPGLKVLFASGYSQPTVLREIDGKNAVPLLAKPYDAEELGKLIRRQLDGEPAGK